MTDPLAGPPGSGTAGASGGTPGASGTHAPVPPTHVPQQYEPRAGERDQGERGQQDFGEDAVAFDARGDALLAKAARQSWPAVLLGGLGMIALGICLLVWPHASLTVVAILVGAALVVSGLIRLWEGLTASNRSGGMRAAYVVIGIVAVLAGLYCLRHHALSLFLLTFLISVYFIAHGIADIGVAVSARVPGRGIRAVLGVCSLAAGIIMLVWPAITLVLLLTIAGAWLIFYGLVLGGLAFSLWRASRALTRRSESSRLVARPA
ncbi:MAG TPA: HdeD family acid-resistance protein [Streptosporangiaceae bacterium]|nr:HdeD family acid-resistance protein [Streptosporangiaceae bacterium]